MRAPLTSVVFAFGLTHDVNAFLPTILGCAVAYGFTVIVMPRSILTEKIARRGRHVFREYGVDPLERHFIEEVMTRSVVTISGAQRVSDVSLRYFGSDQQYRAYPVVEDGKLIGMLDRATLQSLPLDALERPVRESLAGQSDAIAAQLDENFALPGDTCRKVALRLAATGLERLPVIDDSVSRRLIGIVSRSDLLKPSRHLHEEDVQRERVFGFRKRN